MFYTFYQNNPGGRLVINKERGISRFVVVEATSLEEANARCREIGFTDDHCPCCGSRWSVSEEGFTDPSVHGDLLTIDPRVVEMTKEQDADFVYIHYTSGEVVRGVVPHFLKEVMEN